MKSLVLTLGIIIIILFGVLVFYSPAHGPTVPTETNPTSTTTSQPLMSSDGRVAVASLYPGDLIASPLTITGTVTGGGWFFEASFPIKISDGNGKVLGSGMAQAQSDWMSTGTVPFTAIIQFTVPQYATGTVLLSKDNPSGLPANDASLRIPVRFK